MVVESLVCEIMLFETPLGKVEDDETQLKHSWVGSDLVKEDVVIGISARTDSSMSQQALPMRIRLDVSTGALPLSERFNLSSRSAGNEAITAQVVTGSTLEWKQGTA